jgi:predicted phosphodiesterase
MAKRLIFSDLHFGDKDCTLSQQIIAQSLRNFLWELKKVDEIVLAGDILDANISSLTVAVEGIGGGKSKWPKQVGFRKWLDYIFEDKKFQADRIVYVAGNHDYKIWDILSTNRAYVEPVSQGIIPRDLPLRRDVFCEPFISGVAPDHMRKKFIVSYPNYEFKCGCKDVLVTHGHYLDSKQTRFKTLKQMIKESGGKTKEAARKFFIGASQYQAVASAVSHMKDTREFINKVVKTGGNLLEIFGFLRDEPISASQLEAIEYYLKYICEKEPDIFIFGHTHKPAYARSDDFKRTASKRIISKVFDVWNDGTFLENKHEKIAGSFMLLEETPGNNCVVKLYDLKMNGKLETRRLEIYS